mgnify:CR=1 FL=1
MKRQDYLKWDEYFMGIAILSSKRSKDPNTGVGSCIVGSDNRILSLGYNGMPIGCSDDIFPWERDGAPLDTKYVYVCAAERTDLYDAVPVQRMYKIHYTEGDPGSYLLMR